jgi:transposase-like protein
MSALLYASRLQALSARKVALLKCRTVEEAAHSIGVAPKTLYRWTKLAEFDREYQEALLGQFRQSLAR